MKMDKLPTDWQVKNMPEVVKWSSGGTPKATVKEYYENGTIPWLVIGDLNDAVVSKATTCITKLGLDNSSAKKIPAGTLLVAMYGSIGKLGITGIECCTNQAIAFAKELYGITTKYLYYYMMLIRPELISKGKGGTQKNISQSVLNTLKIPVPPISEQERIVSRIEELFSQLDAGVETLKKTKAQLEVYRQAVLKDAFEGFTNKKEIKTQSEFVTSGSRGWAKYYSNDGARFVRITDLTRTGVELKNNSIQRVALPENVEGTRSRLKPNDVLVSITADLGSIAIIPEQFEEAYINQHIAMIRLKNPNQGKFVALYLKSDNGQKDLVKNRRGGGKLGLGLDDIRNTPIPIVTDEEAERTVLEIERKLSVCDSIEKTVDDALQQAEAMRQSILKQAFEGRV